MHMDQSLQAGKRAAQGVERGARGAATGRSAALLARLGYLAIGLVYLIIGGLAARVAFSSGSGGSASGANVDRQTALDTIYQQSFGKVLLLIVAVGIFGYVLYNLTRAFLDTEHAGSNPRGLAKRAGYVVAGLSYGALAVAATQLALGTGNAGKSSNATTQDWTRRLLNQPFGVWLVVLVALVVLGFAFEQFGRAHTASFEKHLDLSALRGSLRDAVVLLGRAGYAARGVVFAEIGVFLIVAAQHHNTKDAKGLGGALTQLASEPYGHLLLAVVALGFVAYGLFCLAQSRYRTIAQS